MKSYNIEAANFALIEQFIVAAKLSWYDDVKVVRVTQSETNPLDYEVAFNKAGDSQYEDSTTIETLDLLSYIALKSGVIALDATGKE